MAINTKILIGGIITALGVYLITPVFSLVVLVVLLIYCGFITVGRDFRSEYSTQQTTAGGRDSMYENAQRIASREISPAATSLGGAHQMREWQSFEKEVEDYISDFLVLVEEKFHPHTAAVFLPRSGTAYVLRSCISKSSTLIPHAVISEGEGLLGSYIKGDVYEVCIPDIKKSQRIDYYSDCKNVRSLMMVPLKAVKNAGFIVVDSTEKDAFDTNDTEWLCAAGKILGRSLYYAYLYKMHSLVHEEVAVVNEWSQKCMARKNLSDLFADLSHILHETFGYDRLSISVKNVDSQTAQVVFAHGEGARNFENLTFSTKDSSIVSLFYHSEVDEGRELDVLCRDFLQGSYEIRYSSSEIKDSGFRSFVAFPLGLGNNTGVILLESRMKGKYGAKDITNMKQLVSSASIAMEKILLLRQQENLAIRDGLTGLYNHRHFERLLHEAIVRSHRLTSPAGKNGSTVQKIPVALVICDIDFFKLVNDNYGHKFGDAVLAKIGAVLSGGIREGVDFAARYGGEEFALILYGSTLSEAYETSERIRKDVEAQVFKTSTGETVHITMSFGVALYDRDAQKQEDLIKKADKALYRAKDAGRNRVELYGRIEDAGEEHG